MPQLVAEEPSVPRYRDDLALTYNNMAFREEDGQVAARDLRKAIELREQLLVLDPTNQYRRRNVARSSGFLVFDEDSLVPQLVAISGCQPELIDGDDRLGQAIGLPLHHGHDPNGRFGL